MLAESRRDARAPLSGIGTIDLRIDYLRPGRGKHFVVTGGVGRLGGRVAVAVFTAFGAKQTFVVLVQSMRGRIPCSLRRIMFGHQIAQEGHRHTASLQGTRQII